MLKLISKNFKLYIIKTLHWGHTYKDGWLDIEVAYIRYSYITTSGIFHKNRLLVIVELLINITFNILNFLFYSITIWRSTYTEFHKRCSALKCKFLDISGLLLRSAYSHFIRKLEWKKFHLYCLHELSSVLLAELYLIRIFLFNFIHKVTKNYYLW